MHAIGVYIMPLPRGGTNIPRSQNMMYRVPRHDVPTTSALCIGFADIVDGKNTVCYYKSMKKDLLSELSLELAELCVNLAKELHWAFCLEQVWIGLSLKLIPCIMQVLP